MQSSLMISTFDFIQEYVNEKLESIVLKFDLIKHSPNKIVVCVSKNPLNVVKIYCSKIDCNLFILYGYDNSGKMVLHDSVSYCFKNLCEDNNTDENISTGGISAIVPND